MSLILFDIDDTLLDHGTSVWQAATGLGRSLDSAVSVDEFCAKWMSALERHYGRYLAGEISFEDQRRARVREVIDPTLNDESADRIIEEYIAAYETSWCLFSDVLPCLDRLSGYRLGIVSNGQGEQQRKKLAQTGIADRFDHILISEEIGCAKPDPVIFQRACALFGEIPCDVVYVGDRYDIDAQAARAAGLRGVWLDRRQGATAEHQPPLIQNLDQLPSLEAAGRRTRS